MSISPLPSSFPRRWLAIRDIKVKPNHLLGLACRLRIFHCFSLIDTGTGMTGVTLVLMPRVAHTPPTKNPQFTLNIAIRPTNNFHLTLDIAIRPPKPSQHSPCQIRIS